jgi:diguanylate cyclase (GGDEF)-like protein/PAS domain S-box-containing protein
MYPGEATANMPVAHEVSARLRADGLTDARDLAAGSRRVIQWRVAFDGTLDFDGDVEEVLGMEPGSDLAMCMESALAPILLVLRSGAGWHDYQLELTADSATGPRRLRVRCLAEPVGGGYSGIVTDVSDHQEIEEHLGDLIDRYRLLVTTSPDMIVVHQDGIIRYVSPIGVKWMGGSHADEFIGLPMKNFVAPSSLGPLMRRIAELHHPGDISTASEMTLVTPAGAHLVLESQSARTTWDGRPAFQVFLRDHSERRRAEAAVRYQANLLASVSDAVVATDLEGRITGWNPAAVGLYLRPASETLGRYAIDILGPGSAVNNGFRAGEVTHQRSNGTSVALRVSVAPLRDEMGEPCGEVAVCADQTERLLAAAERQLAESRFTTVVTALTEGVVVIEADGTISSMNPSARALIGSTLTDGPNGPELTIGRRIYDADGNRLPQRRHPAALTLATGVAERNTVIGYDDDDGIRHWLSMSCETLREQPDGKPASIVCSMSDVTERRASEERLAREVSHDNLTGLSNRTRVLQVLGQYLDEGVATSVLFVDLDRFKTINDAHGHVVGDRILCTVASRIRSLIEPSGTVGRLGSDEFVIVLPNTTPASARTTANLVFAHVAEPIRIRGEREVVITASVGIASMASTASASRSSRSVLDRPVVVDDVADVETAAESLVGDADMAMYRAKERGRSCIEVFDSNLRAATSRRLDVGNRLRRAVADGQIEAYYQPIIRMGTGELLGYEALARWTDSALGPVPPVEFIPVAEDHGLIVVLGRSILHQACQQAAGWRAQPGGRLPDVSVNLSAHQLADPEILDDVEAALAQSGLTPDRLLLEVTESVLMNDVTASIAVLDALRATGVHLVIDDFGTGYSSLNYLRQLPVDAIKIDMSFVTDLGVNCEDDAVVNAIIQLGHILGLSITAEGVETVEQATKLTQLGCDKAQGYLYGRPAQHPQLTGRPGR